MIRIVCFLIGVLTLVQHAAASEFIYRREIPGEFASIYSRVHASLEEARFFVIFEADIGRNLAKNAERWGDEYNRNRFEAARSMVICNPWYANQLMNLDPQMMALCPMNVTLLYKEGTATVLFERLTAVAAGSPAADVLWEMETTIIGVLEEISAGP